MSRDVATAESIARGVREAAKVLDRCRHPVAAADVPHTYTDKFSVGEFVVCAGVEAVLAGLRCLGAEAGEALGTARVWARDHRVQLELQHAETCTFRRRLSKEQGAQGKHAEEVRGLRGTFRKLTGAVTTVEMYEWDYEAQWRVCLVRGADADDSNSTLLLAEGTNRSLVTTCRTDPPYSPHTSDAPFSADLTWLLRTLNADLAPVFAIDRTGRGCHTPRRNSDVEGALQCLSALGGWGREVFGYFVHSVFVADKEHGEDLSMCCASVFSPALPVLRQAEHGPGTVAQPSPGAPLAETPSATDRASLVEESRRRLQEGLATVGASYGSSAAGVTFAAASVAYVASYLVGMHDAIEEGLDYVELLLRDQLVRAIGREVSSHDFATYMSYHCRKLFTAAAAPRPFSYAVRQPARDPEGTLELVRGTAGAAAEMETVACRVEAPPRGTRFALDATTEVVFHGPRFLHAHCAHRFSTEPPAATTLRLRARQFGAYIAVLGVVSGPDTFVPRHAVLLQSRDDLSIPLHLEEIPSAKEFRKAVESLSPEQRRFAQAYRSMQMEATLFAVCVVQVKPQVEAVLNLPQGSLAKEVALLQQLMDLFTAHHIASDLLAYRPQGLQHETSVKGRVACVRSRAHAIATFIAAAKNRQVEDQLERVRLQKQNQEKEEEQLRRREREIRDEVRGGNPRVFSISLYFRGGEGGAAWLQAETVDVSSSPVLVRGLRRQGIYTLSQMVAQKPQKYGDDLLVERTKTGYLVVRCADTSPGLCCVVISGGRLLRSRTVSLARETLAAARDARAASLTDADLKIRRLRVNEEASRNPEEWIYDPKEVRDAFSRIGIAQSRALCSLRAVACTLACTEGTDTTTEGPRLVRQGEFVSIASTQSEKSAKKKFSLSLRMPSISLSMPGTGSSCASIPKPKPEGIPTTIGMNGVDIPQLHEEVDERKADAAPAEAEAASSADAEALQPGEEQSEQLSAADEPHSSTGGGKAEGGRVAEAGPQADGEDISQLPDRLEQHLARIEGIACVRLTTITVGGEWRRLRSKGLLAKAEEEVLGGEALQSERAHAFAVLSALTKCGELPLVSAEMHVVTVVTHCFDETVMDTAVQRNENPVEKVEASMLLMASAVLGRPVRDLLDAPLVTPAFPALFE